jgi:hypothetical protein
MLAALEILHLIGRDGLTAVPAQGPLLGDIQEDAREALDCRIVAGDAYLARLVAAPGIDGLEVGHGVQ